MTTRKGWRKTLPPIKVVSDAEAEECSYVICVRWGGPSYFKDDVMGTCSDCGTAVRHRPHVPKKPLKLCMECFAKHVNAH